MSVNHNHAGIQLSNNKLQIVEVNKKFNNFVLENVEEEYFSDFLNFEDKETRFITILQNAFSEISVRSPLLTNNVSFTLPSHVFNVFDIPYDPALTKSDLQEHINWELSVLMPGHNITDLAVQTVTVTDSSLRDKASLILIVLPKKLIHILNKFCIRNNLVLRYVDHEHFAANNVLFFQNLITYENNYLTILIRDNFLSAIVLENKHPVLYEWFECNNNEEIVSSLNNLFEKSSRRFGKVIDIDMSFVFIDTQSESLIEKIQTSLGIGLNTADPFIKMKYGESLSGKSDFLVNANKFNSAAGVAYRLV
ncbi:MAG: hypothetical protein JW995_06275 [Melioribacteraceae bacterium]|nr:hypothetical protein [Melioribacteraceae bacterium]